MTLGTPHLRAARDADTRHAAFGTPLRVFLDVLGRRNVLLLARVLSCLGVALDLEAFQACPILTQRTLAHFGEKPQTPIIGTWVIKLPFVVLSNCSKCHLLMMPGSCIHPVNFLGHERKLLAHFACFLVQSFCLIVQFNVLFVLCHCLHVSGKFGFLAFKQHLPSILLVLLGKP